VASGGGGDLKPQTREIHELVLADLLATVATKEAADNRSGEAVLRARQKKVVAKHTAVEYLRRKTLDAAVNTL
jgi:hypothetical protein